MECGIDGSVMYASYAASKRMIDLFALAYSTQRVSCSRVATGLLALLDCERQDWNAVSRRLHGARVDVGELGNFEQRWRSVKPERQP